MSYYIGLLSGTSADGVDAALFSFKGGTQVKLVSSLHKSYPQSLKQQVLDLYTPGENEIDRMGALDVALGHFFAECVQQLLEGQPSEIRKAVKAIGSHGQTVRHRPSERFTLQLADPNLIAEKSGICTVADFRRRDMACGGQGAPLAPAFHKAYFADTQKCRVLVNIGGIANITYLPSEGDVCGFDTGPGNGLMDYWIGEHQGLDYDQDGLWAAQGKVDETLLNQLLQHPYFNKPHPKSTGREEFSQEWLNASLNQYMHNSTHVSAVDIQATLLELSVQSISQAIKTLNTMPDEIFICGGGAHNSQLVNKLRNTLAPARVDSVATLGFDPDWVEAATFAWLAKRTLEGKNGNLKEVTGADKEVILGAIYAAGL